MVQFEISKPAPLLLVKLVHKTKLSELLEELMFELICIVPFAACNVKLAEPPAVLESALDTVILPVDELTMTLIPLFKWVSRVDIERFAVPDALMVIGFEPLVVIVPDSAAELMVKFCA
mgnify:CR=1